LSGPVLAIEHQGFVCRAVLFSADRRILASAREELTPVRPRRGQLELDPAELWTAAIATSRSVLVQARVSPGNVAAIGIAGDSSTVIVWDRDSGSPLNNALAAGDHRTEAHCAALRQADVDALVVRHTGLRLGASRAAPKLAWLLDNVGGVREAASAGRAIYGSSATFLLWRMTDGRVHAADAATAGDTLLFNSAHQNWDDALLDIFDIPAAMLPRVFDNATYFGAVDAEHFGGSGPVAVHGMTSATQGALIGHAGYAAGATSVTMGPGCSVLLSHGTARVGGLRREEAAIACRLDGKVTYARLASNEGASDGLDWAQRVFAVSGGLRELDRLAGDVEPSSALMMVPGRVPAGYPWLKEPVPGLLTGIDPDDGPADLVRAALESVAFAAHDIVAALVRGAAAAPETLRVSGALAQSERLAQLLADLAGIPVERPAVTEAGVLGAAWFAAAGAGIWPENKVFVAELEMAKRFEPQLTETRRRERIARWREAVGLALTSRR